VQQALQVCPVKWVQQELRVYLDKSVLLEPQGYPDKSGQPAPWDQPVLQDYQGRLVPQDLLEYQDKSVPLGLQAYQDKSVRQALQERQVYLDKSVQQEPQVYPAKSVQPVQWDQLGLQDYQGRLVRQDLPEYQDRSARQALPDYQGKSVRQALQERQGKLVQREQQDQPVRRDHQARQERQDCQDKLDLQVRYSTLHPSGRSNRLLGCVEVHGKISTLTCESACTGIHETPIMLVFSGYHGILFTKANHDTYTVTGPAGPVGPGYSYYGCFVQTSPQAGTLLGAYALLVLKGNLQNNYSVMCAALCKTTGASYNFAGLVINPTTLGGADCYCGDSIMMVSSVAGRGRILDDNCSACGAGIGQCGKQGVNSIAIYAREF
jgi:hypothetical protein